jgi:hypothetical protein
MLLGLPHGARLASLIFLGAIAACGSDPQFEMVDDLNPDDNPISGGSGGGGGNPGAGTGGGKVVDPKSMKCEPKSCDELGAECDTVADGCGKVQDCGDCDTGELCGIVEHNICTPLDGLCKPIPEDEACEDKQCGKVGDGCDDFYDCGSCDAGEVCGAEEAFQCAEAMTGVDPNNCPSKISSCADDGKRCGIIGDGCGGTIDCNAELGECPTGTYCGIVTPYQCDAAKPDCTPAASCEELGWECGLAVDECGEVHDCAAEGRSCGALEICTGGINAPTECEVPAILGPCELCSNVPNCTSGITRLSGRVITPGRDDANTANQVGVPNAFIYIVRNNDLGDLPPISTGIPAGGTSCDRCSEQDLGPILASATSDATGAWTISGNVPVGAEFLLVTKVGKFRRASRVTVPASGACETTALPTAVATNPTRLPRDMSDGLAVNIPKIAVSTGQIDAIECVFEKMGIATAEFGNYDAGSRIHLYRGGDDASTDFEDGAGAYIDESTPRERDLYNTIDRLQQYDLVVADCEGQTYNATRPAAQRDGLRNYVNRGGRLFASHLSFSFLNGNGTAVYPAGADDFTTGLGPAATWSTSVDSSTATGAGIISLGRPNASPRIENFRDWMVNENVTTAPNYQFTINEPRSQATGIGDDSEEFVHTTARTQQFSFNTPYAAPSEQACGRVAYSGFHVSVGGGSAPFSNSVFPAHCRNAAANNGNLTNQEKVLLYMLFDLGVCVGEDPEVPQCNPVSCDAGRCGVIPNGCGGTVDCGSCVPECVPTTCAAQDAECGKIGDGCSDVIDCGDCPPGQTCGADSPNKCGEGPECEPQSCEDADAECGLVGDGCGDINDCGDCPEGQICGLDEPYKCGTPECEPITCEDVDAECGEIGDGCGGTLDCGDCTSGRVCGAIWANRCSNTPE